MSKLGGILALVSLIFLPLMSCGPITVTGYDLLAKAKSELEERAAKANNTGFLNYKESEGDALIKISFFLCISIISAFLSLGLSSSVGMWFWGLAGGGSLLICYNIARSALTIPMFKLEMGGYLALIGFAIVIANGVWLQSLEEKDSG